MIGEKMADQKMTQTVEKIMVSRIYGMKRGWVFTPKNFLDLGNNKSVAKALESLTKREVIRRLARGLYDYPRKHPKLGLVMPSPESIAIALAGKVKLRIQPSGAYAANLLGLTLQVPARAVFLTDGASRNVKVGNQEIALKRVTPQNMAAAGRVSGLVIQALRYLGKNNVDEALIQKLKRTISDDDRRALLRDIDIAPQWIAVVIRELAKDVT